MSQTVSAARLLQSLHPAESLVPPSRLLALPTELQLVIIEYAVVEPTPLNVYMFSRGRHEWGCYTRDMPPRMIPKKKPKRCQCTGVPPDNQPALSRVCRFLRYETLKIFYQQNQFAGFGGLDYKRVLFGWLEKIGPEHRSSLKAFYLQSHQMCSVAGIEHIQDSREAADTRSRNTRLAEGRYLETWDGRKYCSIQGRKFCPQQYERMFETDSDCAVPRLRELGAEFGAYEVGKGCPITFSAGEVGQSATEHGRKKVTHKKKQAVKKGRVAGK